MKLVEMKKKITRAWNEIVELLREQFVFPAVVQSPENNPYSESEEVACDTQTHKTASKELRHDCEKCETRRNAMQKMLNSKKSMKERIKVLSDEKQRYRGLKQALCRKTKIEKALRIKIRNFKKEMVSKDATTIQSLKH